MQNLGNFFTRKNLPAQKIGNASKVLFAQLRPIGIERKICLDFKKEYPDLEKVYKKSLCTAKNSHSV